MRLLAVTATTATTLATLADRLEGAARGALAEAAEAVAARARELAPKASGEVAASIAIAADGNGFAVAADAPYAVFVELGARPFLAPALDAERGAILDRIATALAGDGA